ncbi:MAG TPA: hypothetical protein VMW46_10380 [Candidatus Desulfaltia sp.]|nr:hypothetical protein [Candidatus Desulfaltia sp.]
MSRRLKIIFLLGFILALSGVGAFYYLDYQRSQIVTATCTKTGDDFVMTFQRQGLKKRKFDILNLRPGLISIATRPEVNDVVLVTSESTIVKTEKKSGNLFQRSLRKNLIVSSIRLIPRSAATTMIDVVISRKPLVSPPFVLCQVVLLFAICCIVLLTIYFLYDIIFRRQTLQNLPFNMLGFQWIILFAIFFIFIALHLDEFLNHFDCSDPVRLFAKTALFNLILAIILTVLFFFFSLKPRGEKLPLIWAVFTSLPVLAIKIPFETRTGADTLLWILNLSKRSPYISFAESLSLMLNKLSFGFFNLFTRVGAKTTLTYTGKLMGVLFIFSLFFFINSFPDLSYKKKWLFFFLFFTFSFNILLFGFPEFRYYSLPFLVFSFLAAKKYVDERKDGLKYLLVAALLAVTAGLFHGTAYFSFPVILLLPLLKDREDNGAKKVPFFLKKYATILLAVGIVAFAFFILIKIFNFDLKFNTAAGGFDGRQFVSLFPENIHFPQAIVFLETGYFISRGWILSITGSFIFLFFLFQWRKKVTLKKSDFVLFLFGISQFVIVLFWGFDLGIREYDLYITPTTLLYLFLIRYLLGTMRSDKSAWKYIVVFSLFSPLYPLLAKIV